MPPEDQYQECPNCGETICTEVEGVTVKFCYECGEELTLAAVRENGMEDVDGYEID